MKELIFTSTLIFSACWFLSAQGTASEGNLLQRSKLGKLYGSIQDERQEPIVGAYIILEDTDFMTASDVDGRFQIADIPYGKYRLMVSYIGTEDKVLELEVDGPSQELFLQLSEKSELLAEAVVVGKSAAREQQERAIQVESVEIRQVSSRVKDISEVIERLPGVNVRGSGSFGDRVDISLNGLNGTAVRSYIDGLPLEFVYPQFTLNNIPIYNIARVDVYKGVIPTDVGTDALGGGVNIITQQKTYNTLQASYGYGSFGTHQAAASINRVLKEGVSLGANLTYNSSENNYTMDAFVWEEQERQEVERFHDAYRLFFGGLSLDVSNKSWAKRFRLTANYNDYYKEVQNGGTITNFAFGDVFYDGGGYTFTLLYNQDISRKLSFETLSSYSLSNVVFEDTTANIYSWTGEVIARNTSQRGELGGSSLSDRDFNNFVNRINLRWRITPKDELLFTNLVARQVTTGRDLVRDEEEDPLTEPQYLTKNIAGLQYQRSLLRDKLELSAAAKWYYFDLLGVESRSLTKVTTNGDQWGYYATAKYDFTDNFFLRASYENALRIPTFFQFFGNGGNIISNVELQPETSDNINFGVSWSSQFTGKWKARATVNAFSRAQNNIIYLTADQFQRYLNAEAVDTRGLEGNVQLRWNERLSLDFNLTRLRQVYGSISEENPSAQFLVGTDFPNVPKFFYNLRLSYEWSDFLGAGQQLSTYTQYKYVDEFNFLNTGAVYDPANYVPVQQRIDAGIRLSFQDNRYALAFNANNIFDADIFDNFSVPRPGRNFNFKLTYRFSQTL